MSTILPEHTIQKTTKYSTLPKLVIEYTAMLQQCTRSCNTTIVMYNSVPEDTIQYTIIYSNLAEPTLQCSVWSEMYLNIQCNSLQWTEVWLNLQQGGLWRMPYSKRYKYKTSKILQIWLILLQISWQCLEKKLLRKIKFARIYRYN